MHNEKLNFDLLKDVPNIQAGSAADALIAELVMGWKRKDTSELKSFSSYTLVNQFQYSLSNDDVCLVLFPMESDVKIDDQPLYMLNTHTWLPTTNIEDAMLVAERLASSPTNLNMVLVLCCNKDDNGKSWVCAFGRSKECIAGTAPLAICRAALWLHRDAGQ